MPDRARRAAATAGPAPRLQEVSAHPLPAAGERRRIWLALGLVALIYAVGIAGIWSTVDRFHQTSSSMPADRPVPTRSLDLPADPDGPQLRNA